MRWVTGATGIRAGKRRDARSRAIRADLSGAAPGWGVGAAPLGVWLFHWPTWEFTDSVLTRLDILQLTVNSFFKYKGGQINEF